MGVSSGSVVRIRLLLVAATLAGSLVMLMGSGGRSRAAFRGTNGLIAFASNRDGDYEIYTMRSDGSHVHQLTHNGTEDGVPAFSPNGKRIAYTRYSNAAATPAHIRVMDADGSHDQAVTHGDARDFSPAFSPSGKVIAFSSDRSSSMTQLFTVHLDGSHVHQVSDSELYARAPVFDRSGKRLIYVAYDPMGGDEELFSIKIDGTGTHQLTENTDSDSAPDLSPSGKKIVWWGFRQNGTEDILKMNLDGSHERNLTDSAVDHEFAPAFSPSGGKIVFQSTVVNPGKRGASGADFEIYVMDADGNHRHELTHNDDVEDNPDWQPVQPSG